MQPKPSGRRRALRWIVSLILAAVVGLYILMPIGFGVAAVFPARQTVGAPPDGFQTVSLQTDDGVALAAWYAPPTHGATIILVHGAGGSRQEVRSYAQMLTRHGYGVLALDLRGFGESAGATNRFGWQGASDIGAAVAYLSTRDQAQVIGGLGLSLGGEVLLGAASTYPIMRAIVADGATQRCVDELRTLPSERPLVRNFVARVMYATVQILSGDRPPSPPLLDAMVAAESASFLLIAGGENEREVAFNELFAATVGERAALWIAPNAPHTGAFSRYPDEYEKRVIAFFDAALLGEKP